MPVVGDKVIIAAGHTVTLNGAFHWGDDTATAIDVRGTLKASRTVSSSLTCRGELTTSVTTGGVAGAWVDFGTQADPIPATVTATLLINDSPTLAANKWKADFSARQRLSFWGAYKNPWSRATAAAASGATSFTVDDATGWAVGDLVLAISTTNVAHHLTTLSAVSGNTITLASGLNQARNSRFAVLNFTRNVTIKSANKSFPGRVQVNLTAGVWGSTSNAPASVGMHSFGYMAFEDLGSSADQRGMYFYDADSVYNTAPSASFEGISCYVTVNGGAATGQWAQAVFAGFVNPYPMKKSVFFGSGQAPIVLSLGAAFYATDCVVASTGSSPSWSGGIGVIWERGVIATAQLIFSNNSRNCLFKDTQLSGVQYIAWGEGVNVVMDGVSFGTEPGCAPMGTTRWVYVNNSRGARLIGCELKNCKFPPGYTKFNLSDSDSVTLDEDALLKVTNGNSLGLHEWKRKYGFYIGDATTRKSGDASIRFEPTIAVPGKRSYMEFPVPSQSGVPVTLVGYLRKNAQYGSTNLPSVSLSGLGSAPATFTLSDVNDEWQKFVLTTTQNSGAPGDLTLRWEGYYNGTGGSATWLDGVYFQPMVTAVRHYGYTLDEKNIVRTLDPYCTLTEAQALALPVVVNHTNQTVTVSAAATPQEVYQACRADLCQTANLARPNHITFDGTKFVTSYTVVNSTNVSGAFTDATGARVYITAPALIEGSRVQVFNEITEAELYNGVIGAGGLSLRVTYASSDIIRLRAEHATKLPLETVGVLSSSGLTFLDVQGEDTTYLTNGIDGSTVTEFTADGANIQVDINDPDGVTSVQRLYAWMQHYQTTEAGVRSPFFGALVAIDDVNYVVDQTLVDMHLDNVSTMPLRVVGGYLSRKDGSTVIAEGSYSIQMDPGKAYAVSVSGGGPATVDNAAIAAAVWDNATRTLTVASGLTPAQEAKIDEIKTKTDNLPTTPADQTTLNQVQTKIDATL